MNRQERIEAMERLAEHIGEKVTVTYVDFWSKTPDSGVGQLEHVEPYVNLEITEERASVRGNFGIPFLGQQTAIMSIVREDGIVLYENPHIYPAYNPFYASDAEKFNYERAKEYARLIRALSWGERSSCQNL